MISSRQQKRRGNILVLSAFLLPPLAALGAFAIDVGYIEYSRTQLQAGADAAALATVEELSTDQATLDNMAQEYVALNAQAGSNPNVTVQAGRWDQQTSTFTSTSLSTANAVQVTVATPNASLFFGSLLGRSYVNLAESAIATSPGGLGVRFLIDDEMIDKDVPAIENLANSLGRDPEELVTARGFNQGKQYGSGNWTWEDNFLDIPAGSTLTLPTGQGTDYENNDAGMFDIEHPQFPFTDDQVFMDFVMYSESGNDPTKWGTDDSYIHNQLDPLIGASPVTDSSAYPSFVNPDFVHVSPVFESDVSTLNMQSGIPRLNAKGQRRGLIAFKIISVGNDPDGSGSVLPELVIEIVDPATIDPLKIKADGSAGGKLMLVR